MQDVSYQVLYSQAAEQPLMFRTGVLNNCPRCGYIAEAWTEGGIIMKVRCHLCGYQGVFPASSDLKKRPWRV